MLLRWGRPLLLLLIATPCAGQLGQQQCGNADDDASYPPDPGGGCAKGYAYICPKGASKGRCNGQSPDSAGCCDECKAGQFQPSASVAAGTLCKPCPQGKYVHVVAAATCKGCPAGKFAPAGATTCSVCPAGKYALSAAATCTDCPAGQISANAGASTCTGCTAGQSSAAGTAACIPCTQGKYAPAAATCTDCPAGQISAQDGASTCTGCTAGQFSTAGATLCTACPADQYSGNAAGACQSWSCCPAGDAKSGASPSSDGTCAACPTGKWSATQMCENGPCGECDPGRYADQSGLLACKACPAGKYQNGAGDTACKLCAAGWYEDHIAQEICVPCAAGRFGSGGEDAQVADLCEACTPGQYAKDPGEPSCKTCPPGKHANAASAATGCEICPAGKFPNPGCTDCPAGKFSNAPGSGSCTPCPKGQYEPAPGGATKCQGCLPGTFGPNSGAMASNRCEECPLGKHAQDEGSVECESCQPGYFAATSSILCKQCAPGNFATQPERGSCLDCNAGQYQTQFAATSCLLCSALNCTAGTSRMGCGTDDAGTCQAPDGGGRSPVSLGVGIVFGVFLLLGLGFLKTRSSNGKPSFSKALRKSLLSDSSQEMNASWLRSAHENLLRDDIGAGAFSASSSSSSTDNVALISYSEIQLGPRIASGAQGIVYKGTYSGSPVAVKELISLLMMGGNARVALQELRREARMLTVLRHPNIVVFYGVAVRRDASMAGSIDSGAPVKGGGKRSSAEQERLDTLAQSRFYIVTELCAASLKELEIHEGTLRADLRLSGFLHALLAQIVAGMAYLHSNGVVHRDLKRANVLLTDGGVPKVCDFGLACVSEDSGSQAISMTAARGTPTHMAPELIASGRVAVSNKVDVYSFGCMAWSLWTGEEPFIDRNPELTQFALMSAIVEGARPDIPAACPAQFAELLRTCWDGDPSIRPTFVELAQQLEAPGGCGLNEA